MIPSDHFVRFYNEVFKALELLGRDHLEAYWREIGDLQTVELADRFQAGGLEACRDYWAQIVQEENCQADLKLTEDYFEFRMLQCPSLSKAMDNDASPCEHYCDHCMAWVEPVAEASGLHAAYDIESRSEPHCVMRIYKDHEKAQAYENQAKLPAKPYTQPAPEDASGGEKS